MMSGKDGTRKFIAKTLLARFATPGPPYGVAYFRGSMMLPAYNGKLTAFKKRLTRVNGDLTAYKVTSTAYDVTLNAYNGRSTRVDGELTAFNVT
jgi:hypothetical protein